MLSKRSFAAGSLLLIAALQGSAAFDGSRYDNVRCFICRALPNIYILFNSSLCKFYGTQTSLVFESPESPTIRYWGQNSYGATHARYEPPPSGLNNSTANEGFSDTANFQKTLSFYCADNSIDVIPMAFLDIYFGQVETNFGHLELQLLIKPFSGWFTFSKSSKCVSIASNTDLTVLIPFRYAMMSTFPSFLAPIYQTVNSLQLILRHVKPKGKL